MAQWPADQHETLGTVLIGKDQQKTAEKSDAKTKLQKLTFTYSLVVDSYFSRGQLTT